MSTARERSQKDGPYAWWNKPAVRHIRNMCDPFRTELNVYLALCEIASNKSSDEFIAGLAEIGNLCGVHNREMLGKAIKQLEFIGLVEVQRSRLRMPSSFRLLRYEGEDQGKPVVL
jgi:hypothetical protein